MNTETKQTEKKVTVLTGHVSAETAYVVDDYPYGFRLRCKIRYWLEFKPGKGMRFVSQTTNPKRPGEVWNKPKASTYAALGEVLIVNEDNGHVGSVALGYYADVETCVSFRTNYGHALPVAALVELDRWIKARPLLHPQKVTSLQQSEMLRSWGVPSDEERAAARKGAA